MFRLINLILMILLINDKIFTGLADEPVTGPPNSISLTDIDTGAFLSELLFANSSPDCPGICIHAVTTLLCEDVLDHILCHSPSFKCCIVNTTSYPTKVETSPPQIEEITTLAPVDSSSYEKHSIAEQAPSSETPVHSSDPRPTSSTRNKPTTSVQSLSTSLQSSSSAAIVSSTQPSVSTKFTDGAQRVKPKCAGDCMEARLSKYCGKIQNNSDACDSDQICCLEAVKEASSSAAPSEPVTETADLSSSSTVPETTTVVSNSDSADMNSLSNSVLNTFTSMVSSLLSGGEVSNSPDASNVAVSNTKNQTGSSEKKIVLDEESLKNDTSDAENNTASIKQSNNKNSENPLDLPPCQECVTMLFGLLCDGVDHGKYCPNGNVCCVYNNSDTIEQPSSSSQESSNNEIGSCPGLCIPKIIGGICSKASKILPKTTCRAGTICCYDPSKGPIGDQQFNSSDANEKPSLLDSNSNDLKYIEPSESTLLANSLNGQNVKFKPPGTGYFQAVPRPSHLIPPNQFTGMQSTTPTNLLPPANWPFMNNVPKIPIYKPLLSNSQMIPNPYLSNARPNYAQVLNMNSNLNNLNNRSPPLFYPPNGPPTGSDMFATLNAHLANSHLSNSVLPTIAPSAFKLNSTSALISHLLSINNIPPPQCSGSCVPPWFKFTCFGTNTIYSNFVCSKPGHLCCVSTNEVATYEATILGGLSNETMMNNLLHNSYFGNNFNLANMLGKNSLPAMSNLGTNLAGSLPNGVQGNLASSLANGLPNGLPTMPSGSLPVNKVGGSMTGAVVAKNSNKPPKNKNGQNFNSNKPIQPSIDRITSESNPLITEKLTEINQPTISGNVNSRNRFSPPSTINKNGPKLTPIISNNNKWSSSLSNLSNNQFTPSEKPLNQKAPSNVDKPPKKPPALMPLSPEHFPEVSSTSSKLPVCGMHGDAPSKWCWQVALMTQDNQFISSGALIGTSWVLTNAHGISKLVQNAEPIFVLVGESEVSTVNADGLQPVAVAAAYIHHNHNGESLENDIALLKLQKPVQLQSNICLICLPARGSVVQANKRCTATGYGYNSKTSLNVREANVPILTDYQCLRKTNLLTNKSFILPTSSFCAGDEEHNGEEGCLFGGSPLACFDEEGYYELSGLVSYGFGCDRSKVSGIYGMVKVSLFINWINQIISVNN